MTGKEPAHHTGTGFYNLHLPKDGQKKSLWGVLKMRFSGEWADHQRDASSVPVVPVDMDRIHQPKEAQATWLGHSTFLIQVNGMNILTDPVFSERASPVSWAGPKRYTKPAIPIEDLPRIDVVLISHNHYDHLDLPSIEAIGNTPLWLVPLRNGHLLESVGVTNFIELDWWERHQIGEWTFTATPVQHWSARGLNDRFECLWSGWVGEASNFRLYFAGDTGYNETDFKETGARFKEFDLALIPIGAYAPRWFMKSMHVNPEEAVQIHQEVGSRLSLAIHWGTFPLTAEPPAAPPLRLRKALVDKGLAEDSFLAVPIGSTTTVPRRARTGLKSTE
jgi:N-acyl-phosphatidylethanolamine-hydrolysing phospholipase D